MSTDIESVSAGLAADHRFLRRLMGEETRIKREAESIFDKAALEGRDLTEDERVKATELATKLEGAKAAVAAAATDLKLRRSFVTDERSTDSLGKAFGDPEDETPMPPPGANTLGEMWVASGVWKRMKSAHASDTWGKMSGWSEAVALPLSGVDGPSRGAKAASSPLLESNFTTGFGPPMGPITTVLPGVETPGLVQLPPTISDLLRVVPIRQGNSVTYRIQKSRTMPGYPASQPVAEGATKPTYATEFDVVQVPMKKLAAITKISDEWIEDDEATVAFLNTELPMQIRQVEESWLAALLYAGVSDATGLGYGTVSFDNIAAAISVIEAAGFNANGMVIKPQDWWNLTVSKFGTGAGDKTYVGGGPFGTTGNPWGLRVVKSPYATAGHPLIGDFTQGAWIGRRGGIRMDSTNSDADDFEKNLIALRVELREAFQKVYPEAFKTAAI